MPKDRGKDIKQLLKELEETQKRLKELATLESAHKPAEEALRESEARFRHLFETMAQGVVYQSSNGEITFANPASERILGLTHDQMMGRTSFDRRWRAIHEDGSDFPGETHPAMVSLKTGEPVSDVVMGVYHPQAEQYHWIIVNAIPQFKPGENKPYQAYTTFGDITERKRLEDNLNERVKELNTLYGISGIAELPDTTLDEIYEKVTDLLPQGWQYPEITCARITIDNKEFRTKNWREPKWKQSSPVKAFEAATGSVEVGYLKESIEADEGPFLKEERQLIDAVAERLGRITERRHLEQARIEQAAAQARAEEVQQSRRRIVAVQESLRKDIAQQVHGTVQNRLIILMHRLAELEKSPSSQPSASEIADIRQKLGEVLDEQVRPISHRLFPSILRRGLIPALQSLADQFETAQDINMELSEEMKREERVNPRLIAERIRLAVYRIAEEALNNTTKHANSGRITVRLVSSAEGWLQLTVLDDGQGFDMKSASAGQGILMMQDYAEVVGGSCVIRSTPGKGTEVTATVPLIEPGAGHPERA